ISGLPRYVAGTLLSTCPPGREGHLQRLEKMGLQWAGWPWHRSRMRDPERAARLWLAVAVATLWLVSVGGGAGETVGAGTLRGCDGVGPQPPTDAPRHTAATGERVSPGLGGAVGRLAAPGAVASRSLCPRTLASCPNAGSSGSRVAAGPAHSRMRRGGTGVVA